MIIYKTADDIARMAEAGELLFRVFAAVEAVLEPGVSGHELDAVAERAIRQGGAVPAFKGYRGYPASICLSIDEEVVHGIPSDRTITKRDLVSIDMGLEMRGFFADSARSYDMGSPPPVARRLMDVTAAALDRAIEQCIPGKRLGDVSHAIQAHVEKNGFSVVRELVGHGIGRAMHEDPAVPNFGEKGRGLVLKEGVVLAIEPMVNEGGYEIEVLDDDWTVVTRDRRLSAHFEHTVAVTADGPRILTLPAQQGLDVTARL